MIWQINCIFPLVFVTTNKSFWEKSIFLYSTVNLRYLTNKYILESVQTSFILTNIVCLFHFLVTIKSYVATNIITEMLMRKNNKKWCPNVVICTCNPQLSVAEKINKDLRTKLLLRNHCFLATYLSTHKWKISFWSALLKDNCERNRVSSRSRDNETGGFSACFFVTKHN